MRTDLAWALWFTVSMAWLFAAACAMGMAMTYERKLSTSERRFCWGTLIFGCVWVLPVAIRVWAMVVAA